MTSRITALAAAAALILSAAGCERVKYDDSIPRVSGIALDVAASIEDRLWAYGDRVEIIDTLGEGRISLPCCDEGSIVNSFRVENWPESSVPSYLYWAKDSLCQTSSTVIPFRLPPVRKAAAEPLTDLAFGSAVCEGGDGQYSCTMFNPLRSIGFGISSKDEITSFVLSSKEGVLLCGKAEFDLRTISEGKVNFTLKEGKDTLKLLPSGRCFVPGDSCYAAILPDLEFTPVFTFTDTIGRKVVKSLKRKISTSDDVFLSSIDEGIEFDPAKIRPDTVILKVEFGNWTLTPDLPAKGSGTLVAAGETYTYPYVSPSGYKADYPFIICKGTASGADYYEYTNAAGVKAIKFDKTTAWIALPVISGMRIHKLSLTNINTNNKGFKLQKVKGYTSDVSNILHTALYCNSTETVEFNGAGQEETLEDQQYYIYFYYGNGGVWSDLTVEYTKVEEQ